MSLDVHIYKQVKFKCECGKENSYITDDELYNGNITHNLIPMAKESNLDLLWKIENVNASELIKPIQSGLTLLKSRPDYFKQFNSPNGWGIYDDFIKFLIEYLNACKQYPDGYIKISR